MKKLAAALLATLTITVGLIAGTGKADAAPLAGLIVTGENLGVFGNHSFCRGTMNARFETVPGKPGFARVTLTSFGFTGEGATWKRNPKCRLLIGTTHHSLAGLFVDNYFPATFGERPGERVTRDIYTGSGLVNFFLNAYATNSPVRVQQGYGLGSWLLVP